MSISINQQLAKMKWFDINELGKCVYGNPFFELRHDFNKYPDTVKTEFEERGYYSLLSREFDFHSVSCTGCRIRFQIPEDEFSIRVEVKGDWEYGKVMFSCSAGIDVYQIDESGKYVHIDVFFPRLKNKRFEATVRCKPFLPIVLFLPCYNTIVSMQIGVKECEIRPVPYPDEEKMIFYGHCVTQGASASRSGNAYVNILSRYCDSDIINYSMSSCCKGLLSVAKEIAGQKTKLIVIDAAALDDLRYETKDEDLLQIYLEFYRIIREKQKDVPLILTTRPNYSNNQMTYFNDNESMRRFYRMIKYDPRVHFIDFEFLFEPSELSLVALDEQHVTDYGMIKIAQAIYDILVKYNYT